MNREEIQSNIDNNHYTDPNFSGGINFVNLMVVQPLIDSYAKSSYAKKTGLAFYHGYHTGVFNNFTFMGGHHVLGNGMFSSLTKRITKHISTFNTNSTGGLGIQYLNPKDSEAIKFFSPENLKKYHADHINDLVEGGLGFGKDARVLQSLRRSGLKLGADDFKKVSADVLEQKIVEHLKTLEFSDLTKIAKEGGIKLDIETVKTTFRRKNVADVFHKFPMEKTVAKEIFGDTGHDSVLAMQQAIKQGKGELFEKIINTKVVTEFFDGKYGKAFAKVHGDFSEQIGKGLIKNYLTTSGVERFFSSTPVRIITGNFLQGALGNAITLSLAAASIISSIHQSAALGDFKNTSLYNFREQHFTEANNVTGESLNSHLMIRQFNVNDYFQMLSQHNVSKSYLKDIDPIESRFEYSKVDNFTIF